MKKQKLITTKKGKKYSKFKFKINEPKLIFLELDGLFSHWIFTSFFYSYIYVYFGTKANSLIIKENWKKKLPFRGNHGLSFLLCGINIELK